MRWSIAAMLALLLTSWPTGSEACDCIDRSHPVKHRVWAHHVAHGHFAARGYERCPIALVDRVRPGCNSYSQVIIGFR